MYEDHPIFRRYPELREFVRILSFEVQQAQRPANEIILYDEKVMKMLGCSKRKLDGMRAEKLIPFHQPIPHSSYYYLLGDILDWLKKSRVESIENERKF
jgi:hypothetical protein